MISSKRKIAYLEEEEVKEFDEVAKALGVAHDF